MIFGYAFAATIVSSIVTAFISLGFNSIAFSYTWIVLLLCIFVLFTILRKIKFVKKKMDWWIERFCYKHILKEENNTIVVLEEYGDVVVATVVLRKVPECILNKTLIENEISKQYGIMVLLTKQFDGTVVRASASTVLKKDDMVMVLGKRRNINKLFKKG
jgi:NhaP-type Na+/H+ and K+/H+ antiporter